MKWPGLTEEENEALIPLLTQLKLEKGKYLYHPEDQADCVYYVESGRLAVQVKTGFEDKLQVIAFLDSGTFAGEKGLAGSGVRGMSVVAAEDSLLYLLSCEKFAELEKSHPATALKVLKKLLHVAALRLQASSERLAHVL